MYSSKFIHTYKNHKGQKRPMITAALRLDVDEKDNVRGVGLGFAYCSVKDHPNKKIGRMIANQRATSAIDKQKKPDGYEGNVNKVMYTNRHLSWIYIPFSIEYKSFLLEDKIDSTLAHIEDTYILNRVVLALANLERFKRL